MGHRVGGHPDTVLLVHADVASRAALAKVLESNRYAVSAVGTGNEGLRMLANAPVPCLVLYVMTGADDGSLEFRAAQMADPTFAGVPTIMCTAVDLDGGGLTRGAVVDALLALVGRHCAQVSHAH